VRAKKNAVAKIGKAAVSFGDDGRAVALGDNRARTRAAANIRIRGPPDPLEPLFTVNEAAAILRCSASSLNKWRLTGQGPPFVRVGARVRYRRADLAAFIATSTRNSTSDPGGRAVTPA
jgi:hypothetical protein